jgi:AraC-like DNA-binding protein
MSNRRLEIEPDQVRKLAGLGCTNEEIASFVGCSHDTLTRRFKQELEDGRAQGKASLRRKQWETAMSGNVTMLIWLGKQYLAQTDKQEIKTDGDIIVNLTKRPDANSNS